MIRGDSTVWRQRFIDVHDKLLARIAVVWPRCAARFEAVTIENSMTDQLVLALQRDPVAKDFLIVPQLKLLDKDQRGDVVTKGFIDIAVFFNLDNSVYVAFECKRLNVRYEGGRHSLAGKYADEGLMRYISAQYARALPLGAMLGYVMDGDVDWVLVQLGAAFRARKKKLCLHGSLTAAHSHRPLGGRASIVTVVFLRCFQTRHRRPGESVPFEVRHALLPL